MNLPYKPILSRDLAGVLPLFIKPKTKPKTKPTKPSLAVSLCNYESYSGGDIKIEQKRNKALFHAIKKFATKNDVQINIYSLNNHPVFGDDAISYELQKFLKEASIDSQIINANNNLLSTLESIASSTVVLSTRLHGAITAYLYGIPFALIEYHTKCSDFLDDIRQVEDFRIAGTISNSDKITVVLDNLFNNKSTPKLDYHQYIKESVRNFTNAPWSS